MSLIANRQQVLRGLPDGSRCEVCGRVGPRSNMDWSSVQFDPADEFHLRLVKHMPEPFRSLVRPGHKIGFWAHVNGHGCDVETISTEPARPEAGLNNEQRLKRQGTIFNHDGKCGKIIV